MLCTAHMHAQKHPVVDDNNPSLFTWCKEWSCVRTAANDWDLFNQWPHRHVQPKNVNNPTSSLETVAQEQGAKAHTGDNNSKTFQTVILVSKE